MAMSTPVSPRLFRSFRLLLAVMTMVSVLLPARLARTASAQATTSMLLVLNDTAANPFGKYLGEILRYEGLSAFDTINLADVTAGTLSQYSLVLLAPTALTSAQATLFSDHVTAGRRLIAFKPDAQIKSLFGLGAASGSLNDVYVRVTPGSRITPAPGVDEFIEFDIVTRTLQTKAPADRYALEPNANEIARLYSDAITPTPFPAVAAKGRAVAFVYDLGRAIAYLRQGNPSGLTPNGVPVTRTQELYERWVDLDRVDIPQADEQIRLLARVIHTLSTDGLAVPQTWYFPNKAPSVLLVTADAHANPTSYFDRLNETVNGVGGKVSIYSSISDQISTTLINAYSAQGHNVSPLIYAKRIDTSFGINNLTEGFLVSTLYFTQTYGLPPLKHYRTFDNAWEGWSRGAEIAAAAGYRMDLNTMHVGKWLQKPDGGWARGHFTGGGRPIPFVKADGTIVDVYQQPTQLYDQQLMPINSNFENLALPAGGIAATRGLIDRSIGRDYAALALNVNVDYTFPEPMQWVSDTIRYAAAKGVPSLSMNEWLRFTDVRRGARYTNVSYDAPTGVLNFTLVASATSGVSLTVMLPTIYRGRSLVTATVDGAPVTIARDLVKQSEYGFVTVPAGTRAFDVRYSQDTPISGLSATNNSPVFLRQPVVFTATASVGSNVRYVWNFGDGEFGNGAVVTHTYSAWPASGTISVSLQARNGESTALASTLVTLRLPPAAYLPLAAKP
jgi:hypothetical protein